MQISRRRILKFYSWFACYKMVQWVVVFFLGDVLKEKLRAGVFIVVQRLGFANRSRNYANVYVHK